MQYILAIDGGSTKTSALCATLDGEVVGEGHAGPTSLTSTSVGAAGFSLREAIRQATENLPQGYEIVKAVMGLAGMDTKPEKESAFRVFQPTLQLFNVRKLTLVNDSIVAMACGTDDENAVILISGTGSVCYGRNKNGDKARSGGLDFFLTDQGSGYSIGRHVMREAVKSADGRIKKTILEDMVKDHFRIREIDELKHKVNKPLISKSEVAAISNLCFKAMTSGDQEASKIIKYSIVELVSLASAVIERLELTDTAATLVLSGRVLANPHVNQEFTQQILAKYPKLKVHLLNKPAVYGALKLALRV